ncbi:PEGA domain-containing protein [Patescibacteria group bacterium]|nr:PEGA domain-containing protein [Patescibacteria group bacterium]
MEKTLRRLTYSFFFLLFFIIAPLLTVYSLGYRYDFDTGNIEKNGAFYIKSYPRGADIYVDDQKSKRQTPSQVLNIKPGKHKIVVSKNKYVSWQKNLDVSSGETTFAEDIVLFLENREKTLLGQGSDRFLINKQKYQYAYIDENKLIITDVEQGKKFDVFNLEEDFDLVDWSADNQMMLLKNQSEYFYFDINQKTLTPLLLDKIQKILWEENSSTFIYLKDNKLYRKERREPWDSSAYPDKLLEIDQSINDFDIEGNWLIVQYTLDKENYIEQFDRYTLESKQFINDASIGNLRILLADNNYLIFLMGSKLYIKNTFQDLVTIPVTLAELHDERLLLSNGHEIILFDYKNQWQSLIDRSSNLVSEIMWHPNGSYFISEINDRTNLIEIDGRDQRNTINLLENPRKKMYLFNKKGDRLFILTPEENFYLTIQ